MGLLPVCAAQQVLSRARTEVEHVDLPQLVFVGQEKRATQPRATLENAASWTGWTLGARESTFPCQDDQGCRIRANL
jgi:hypothetical protein